MKVIIALDSFKGSCSAADACAAVARGIHDYNAQIDTVCLPISDGGEGLIDALSENLTAQGYRRVTIEITGPYLNKTPCSMLIKGTDCIVEMAQCAGLELEPASARRAVNATSYGLGEAVAYALNLGCRSFRVGLGGSATNDGGAGFVQALGVRFYTKDGAELTRPVCGRDLINLGRIDISGLHPGVSQSSFTGTCDVNNPLLGSNGATYIFGPQKGLQSGDLELLESGMRNYADLLTLSTSRDCRDLAGAGAAGGMGAALLWFCNASLQSGIDEVLDLLSMDKVLPGSSLVFVGEGKMDRQSSQGKAPIGVAKRAKRHEIPVVALCGCVDDSASILYDCGIDSMFSICTHPMTLEQSIEDCKVLLRKGACNIIRLFDSKKECA